MYKTVSPIRPRKLDWRDEKGRQAPEFVSNDKIKIYNSCYTEYKALGPSLIYNTAFEEKIAVQFHQ